MKKDEVDAASVTRETYDRIAPAYARRINNLISDTWVGRFEKSLLDRLVTSVMTSGSRRAAILDIGCGNGKDTFYLSRKEGICVVGLDYSSGMLSEARSSFSGVLLVQMDMRHLGLSGSCFDGAWANGCLYHIPRRDLPGLLLEVTRVLKPAGVFSFSFKLGTGERLEENPKSYGGAPRFYAYYGMEEMKSVVIGAGLTIMDAEPYPEAIFGERIVQMWALKL